MMLRRDPREARLLIAHCQAMLAHPNAQAAQPLDVFRGVAAMAARRASGFGRDPEPLGQPQVAYGDTERFGSFGYGASVLCNVHARIEPSC